MRRSHRRIPIALAAPVLAAASAPAQVAPAPDSMGVRDTTGLAAYTDSLFAAMQAARPHPAPGTLAPQLEATDLDGYAATVPDFNVVYLFASLLSPRCHEEFARAEAVDFELAGGLRFVYLNDADELRWLRRHFDFEHPGVDVPAYAISAASRAAFGGLATPMCVGLDRYGRIVRYAKELSPWLPE